jgi:hypothetical protein
MCSWYLRFSKRFGNSMNCSQEHNFFFCESSRTQCYMHTLMLLQFCYPAECSLVNVFIVIFAICIPLVPINLIPSSIGNIKRIGAIFRYARIYEPVVYVANNFATHRQGYSTMLKLLHGASPLADDPHAHGTGVELSARPLCLHL